MLREYPEKFGYTPGGGVERLNVPLTTCIFSSMGKRENSASRLHKFLQGMVGQPENILLERVLLISFGIEGNQGIRHESRMLGRILELMFAELEELTSVLKSKDFSESSYQPIVTAFERMTAAGLATQWQSHRAIFQTSIQPLLIFSEGLESDGPFIDPAELIQLKNSVQSFLAEIEKSDVSEHLKRFVFEQLVIILKGLQEYRIAGIKAFKVVLRDSFFHEAENQSVVKANENSGWMQKLRGIRKQILLLTTLAVTVNGFLEAGKTFLLDVGKVVEVVVETKDKIASKVQEFRAD